MPHIGVLVALLQVCLCSFGNRCADPSKWAGLAGLPRRSAATAAKTRYNPVRAAPRTTLELSSRHGSPWAEARPLVVNVQIEAGRIWRGSILRTNARANVVVANVIIMALPSLKGHGGTTIGTIIPPDRALNSIAETTDCRVPSAVFRVGIAVGGHRFCFGWFLNRLWRRIIHQR